MQESKAVRICEQSSRRGLASALSAFLTRQHAAPLVARGPLCPVGGAAPAAPVWVGSVSSPRHQVPHHVSVGAGLAFAAYVKLSISSAHPQWCTAMAGPIVRVQCSAAPFNKYQLSALLTCVSTGVGSSLLSNPPLAPPGLVSRPQHTIHSSHGAANQWAWLSCMSHLEQAQWRALNQ